MNLLSLPVLAAAGVLASPALWQTAMTGAVPFDVAVTRYLAVVVATWVALSMVGSLMSWGPKADAPASGSDVRAGGGEPPGPDMGRPAGLASGETAPADV
ncbi:hypothetical protein [Nocardioides psychrotolerans]|uniref:hypothetical protein n=1 Tax=Nocardioides psychrotolerans TaxID=1005945 RepID=UPI003137DF4E